MYHCAGAGKLAHPKRPLYLLFLLPVVLRHRCAALAPVACLVSGANNPAHPLPYLLSIIVLPSRPADAAMAC